MALLHELKSYQARIEHSLASAREDLQRAASWQRWTTSKAKDPRIFITIIIGFGAVVPILIGVSLTLAQHWQLAAIVARGPYFGVGIWGLSCLGILGYFIWNHSGARRKSYAIGPTNIRVACPQCGAAGQLTPGSAVDICRYCNTGLIPSKASVRRSVDAAQLTARQANMAQLRAIRSATASHQSYSVGNIMPYFILGSLIAPSGGGALSFTIATVRGDEPFEPGILILWGLTLGIMAAMFGLYYWRRQRNQAFHRALSDVLCQYPGGHFGQRLGSIVEWLNRYWEVTYPLEYFYSGPHLFNATLDAQGFPVMVHLDPSSSGHESRFHVLIAAWKTPSSARSSSSEVAEMWRDRVAKFGFSTADSEAGILAVADGETIKSVRKGPDSLHELTPVIFALTQLAQSLGRQPGQEIP